MDETMLRKIPLDPRSVISYVCSMDSGQARKRIWEAIKRRGVRKTALEIERTARALHYFAAGGGMSPTTIARLRALLPASIPASAWLAVMSAAPSPAEDGSTQEATS
jgi:hypothetical protein